MSENERKAICQIIHLQALCEQRLFRKYTDEIYVVVNQLFGLYKDSVNPKTKKDVFHEMRKLIYKQEEDIASKRVKANLGIMFSLLVEMVEPYTRYTSGARYELWSKLLQLAINNPYYKRLKKLGDKELTNIETGIELAGILK